VRKTDLVFFEVATLLLPRMVRRKGVSTKNPSSTRGCEREGQAFAVSQNGLYQHRAFRKGETGPRSCLNAPGSILRAKYPSKDVPACIAFVAKSARGLVVPWTGAGQWGRTPLLNRLKDWTAKRR
jgi:hypothetical protein